EDFQLVHQASKRQRQQASTCKTNSQVSGSTMCVWSIRNTIQVAQMLLSLVAGHFSEEKGAHLDERPWNLYGDMMQENFEILVSLGFLTPETNVISWVEQGKEPH
ncbi:unnamed protein product, partial [Eretmochelys imbricata]